MVERRLIAVEGLVQGVGFRPFIHRLATALNLRGTVRNDATGVSIDVEGDASALDEFLGRLSAAPPASVEVERLRVEPAPPGAHNDRFAIVGSDLAAGAVPDVGWLPALVAPDVATCDACLAELFDPANRRYRYSFVTCTECGPRFTIVCGVPYDRPRTTMAHFAMCAACRREYDDPHDRRFHAQPIACPDCGPTVALRDPAGRALLTGDDAVRAAAAALVDGRIVAVKGLGGYHCACDATNPEAVRLLRSRKRRDAKPLALMVADLDAARDLCGVGTAEAALLRSSARPIVLLAKRSPGGGRIADEVAPGNAHLGVMLPYTPLHHLLLADARRPLVMTSGNCSDEPIAVDDRDALGRLGGIADLFVTHDRPIASRCDDSVVRPLARGAAVVRRSRGFAPRPVTLAEPLAAPLLAVGGHLKNAFCLATGRAAFISHHVGDLESAEAYQAFRDSVAHYTRLFDIRPAIVAHDLHPEYASTKFAEELAAAVGASTVGVQHHHAHVASCLAEHGSRGPVIGVSFDGTGYGTDGAVWGGEFLLVDGAGFRRLAHLGYVPLPGGDAAARRPWRVAVAHLWAAYDGDLTLVPEQVLEGGELEALPLLAQLLRRGVNSPPTSSVGRLFDAVASLLGLRHVIQFEGQAAMEVEAVADPSTARSYPVELRDQADGWAADPGPIIRGVAGDVAAGRPVAEVAGAFHNALRDVTLQVAVRIRAETGVGRVALTGGVFQNGLLTAHTADALARAGFELLLHERVPCNDGGLSLGQTWVAGLCA